MIPHVRWSIIAGAAAVLAISLPGCSASAGPDPEEVKTVIQDLGGTPESIYQQKILSKDFTTGAFIEQTVYLVPTSDDEKFRIVDSSGTVYRDFGDLLRNIG